jgi:hypothetical protein
MDLLVTSPLCTLLLHTKLLSAKRPDRKLDEISSHCSGELPNY